MRRTNIGLNHTINAVYEIIQKNHVRVDFIECLKYDTYLNVENLQTTHSHWICKLFENFVCTLDSIPQIQSMLFLASCTILTPSVFLPNPSCQRSEMFTFYTRFYIFIFLLESLCGLKCLFKKRH